jgi:dynein heavy chain
VGKGWFDLNETNRDIYEYSKLKRLLVMVNMMMEDSMRYMSEQSVSAYELLILESAAGRKVTVNGTSKSQIEIEPVEGYSEEAFSRPALFLLDLSIKDGAPNYNLDPIKFVNMCLAVVTNGLGALQAIEQLEHQVMDKMFWPVKGCLKAVSIQEPHISVSYERIKSALLEALKPIDTYRELYNNYIPFT